MFSSPKANILIPQLITNFTDYNKNLSNRIKVDTLFMSFNEEANKNFNKFVELSNNRYKSIKSGNTLNNILGKQMPTFKKINKEVRLNEVYSTTDLDEDKRRLGKSVNKYKTQQLNLIRDKLKDSLRDFSKAELRLREKLLKKIMEKRKIEEMQKIKKPKINENISKFNHKTNESNVKRNHSKHQTHISSYTDVNEKDPITEGEELCKLYFFIIYFRR